MSASSEQTRESGRFGFGANWRAFLATVDEARIAAAQDSLRQMLDLDDLSGKTFLDIGAGSGLFSLAARRLGAAVRSFDYDRQSVACARELKRRYYPGDASWEIEAGSALDAAYLEGLGQFDIVYSWGVLHHTGDLWKAVDLAADLTKEGGILFIAIYNDQGGASRRWLAVKRLYNNLPSFLQPALAIPIAAAYEFKYALVRLVRGRNPLPFADWRQRERERGMSVWRDWVDWCGGLPFEVAKPERVILPLLKKGFRLKNLVTCGGSCGAEGQARAVSEGLVARGHEVAVLTQPVPGSPEEEIIGGVRVLRRLKALALGPLWGLTFMASVYRELRRLGNWAGVIHCHQIYLHSAVAARWRRRQGPPVICKALYPGVGGDLARLADLRAGRILMTWAKRLDRVIAICRPIEEDFHAWGFPPERIVRIPNSVDVAVFHPDSEAAAATDEWLFAGRLAHQKGLDVLLEAIGAARATGRAIRVALAGQGPSEGQLRAKAQTLGLSDAVRFVGAIPGMTPLYQQSKGVLLPSRGEGLSNVLLEALACAKPLIATDVGGTREVLEGDTPIDEEALRARGFVWARHGILVRPEDPGALAGAILAAEADPGRAAACARAGCDFVRIHYSRDAVLDKLEQLYQDLTFRREKR
ncbi:MAG: glycosyltransferase [Candidatus Sumerlaeota bacterium]|nr:glycosyltransferase [Candidatus Sumerlaeota bacterium]